MATQLIGEVLSIGDEIICGKLLDTNSQWLSQKLSELGVSVRHHASIGDRVEDYQLALETACRRSDVIVSSGGLGPTEDDLTSAALAEFAGVSLEFDESSWAQICSIFAKRNRPIAESNRKQAMRPLGSQVIFNPNGTAPGIDLILPERAGRRARIFALPGVPAEVREMWPEVAREIRMLVGSRAFFQHSLNCFGVGESDLESMIPSEIMRRGRDPLVGITASQATISLRVSTFGESTERCQQFAQPTIDQLRTVLGNLVYADQDEPLESVVMRELKKAGKTMAIVDLGLGGRLYQALSECDHRGEIIVGGLQLDENSLTKLFPNLRLPSCWSEETFLAIAREAFQLMQSDLGLVISPIPDSSVAEQSFRIALSDGRSTWTPILSCAGHPAIRLVRATKGILNYLRLNLFP